MGIRIAVAAVVVGAVVAGCGGDPAPTEIPSAVVTSTPPVTSSPPSNPPTTAATTPTPPPLPTAATADTPAGAEAFARYWLSVLNYSAATGSTALLRQVADCPGCNALADGIDKLQAEGGRTVGGRITVAKTNVANFAMGKAALVDLTYNRASRTVIDEAGKTQSVSPERNVRLLITLRRTNAWLITNAQTAT